ncbi:MAG: hypothetical protein OER95_08655 [Acidimicrobiia bacterium]|nr:hypothetical protein [Acidimicrobiia bacterium]
MTYDFVVWDGPAPLSNAHARSDYQRLRAENPSTAEPTQRMRSAVNELLRFFPDLDMPGGSASPWADTPLIHSARGSVLYVRTQQAKSHQARDLLIAVARDYHMVVFDPQQAELVPSAGEVERITKFQLPPPGGLDVHVNALLTEEIKTGRPMVTILEHADSCFYLQWMVENGAVTLEAQSDSRIPMEHRLSSTARDQMFSLGFETGDPNWRQYWPDATTNLDDVVKVISRVFYEVRGAQAGQAMSAHRFPVPTAASQSAPSNGAADPASSRIQP